MSHRVFVSAVFAVIFLSVVAAETNPVDNPLYDNIFEPMLVMPGAPNPGDRKLMEGENGEIRIYGAKTFEHENGKKESVFVVRKSRDHGLTFDEEMQMEGDPGPRVKSPYSGAWITVVNLRGGKGPVGGPDGNTYRSGRIESSYAASFYKDYQNGVYLFRSEKGPDGPFTAEKLGFQNHQFQRLPLPLKSRKRWIISAQRLAPPANPFVLLSDDDGKTWKFVAVPAPACQAGYPKAPVYPHKGWRWVPCGSEPSVAETRDGKLIMLMRTSADVHYVSYSEDGGEKWTKPAPSQFYSVATMPLIKSLSDGRLLAVWNNTTPLAEHDHATDFYCAKEGLAAGKSEDAFTNRDALHAALSDDDGKTWYGFREIYLNPIRNAQDFRLNGGWWALNDKSVHQTQAIELPNHKIFLHLGQHPAVQCCIIFDLDFLKVKTRRGNFDFGLRDWSTHLYYWSVSGSKPKGHCAWNRVSGAALMPSPLKDGTEALLIGRHEDPRLLTNLEGAVWNFPAGRSGNVSADLMVPKGSGGIRVSLTDRWLNACDEHAKEYAQYSFVIDGEGKVNGEKIAENDKRFRLTMSFNLDKDELTVKGSVGKPGVLKKTMTLPPPFGDTKQLSYLHLQTAADKTDNTGVWLFGTEANVK